VSGWRAVEVYAAFVKLTGEIEVGPGQRLTDEINRVGEFIELRQVRTEPLSVDHPVLSRLEARATLAKSAVVLLCPADSAEAGGQGPLWREKVSVPVALQTSAYSIVADAHVEARHTLRDELERFRGDFLPLTNVSALWVAAVSAQTHSLQRRFALVNPGAIVSFAERG
jgi:hypothetical protein